MPIFSPDGRGDGCCVNDQRYRIANRILSPSLVIRRTAGDGISKRLIAAGDDSRRRDHITGVPDSVPVSAVLGGNQDECRVCPSHDKYLAFGDAHDR